MSGSDGGLAREGSSGRGPDPDHVSLTVDATGIPATGVRMTIGGNYQEGLSGKNYTFWLPRGRHSASVSLGDGYKPFEGEIDVYKDVLYKIVVKGEARPSLKVLPRASLVPVDDVTCEGSSVPVNVRVELSDLPRSERVPASVRIGDQYKEAYTGDTLLFTVPTGICHVVVEYEGGILRFDGDVKVDRDTVFVARVVDIRSVMMRTRPRIELERLGGTGL